MGMNQLMTHTSSARHSPDGREHWGAALLPARGSLALLLPTWVAEGGRLHPDLQLLYLPAVEVHRGLEGDQHQGLQPHQVATSDQVLGRLRGDGPQVFPYGGFQVPLPPYPLGQGSGRRNRRVLHMCGTAARGCLVLSAREGCRGPGSWAGRTKKRDLRASATFAWPCSLRSTLPRTLSILPPPPAVGPEAMFPVTGSRCWALGTASLPGQLWPLPPWPFHYHLLPPHCLSAPA